MIKFDMSKMVLIADKVHVRLGLYIFKFLSYVPKNNNFLFMKNIFYTII